MKRFLHIILPVLAVILAGGAAAVLLLPPPSPPEREPPRFPVASRASLVLGTSPAGPAEAAGRSEFSFGESIYATVAISAVEPGDRVLTFRWINPRGGVQETFRREFSSPNGEYRAWSWLELRGEEWLPVPLGPIGPRRFLGRWRIEVDLDGAPLARAGFTVR